MDPHGDRGVLQPLRVLVVVVLTTTIASSVATTIASALTTSVASAVTTTAVTTTVATTDVVDTGELENCCHGHEAEEDRGGAEQVQSPVVYS